MPEFLYKTPEAKVRLAVLAVLACAGVAFFLRPARLHDAGAPGRDPASVRPEGAASRSLGEGETRRGPAIVPVDPRVGTLMEFADYLESHGVTGRHAPASSADPAADAP